MPACFLEKAHTLSRRGWCEDYWGWLEILQVVSVRGTQNSVTPSVVNRGHTEPETLHYWQLWRGFSSVGWAAPHPHGVQRPTGSQRQFSETGFSSPELDNPLPHAWQGTLG